MAATAATGGQGQAEEEGAKKAPRPKPRTASLFADMSLDTVTLDDALRLLSLPRVVGADPETGDEITAQNGRYGPVPEARAPTRARSSARSSSSRHPRRGARDLRPAQAARAAGGGRRCASWAPTRCPGKPIAVKDGRFGPYVTDGETNATLRKGDEPEHDHAAAGGRAAGREAGPRAGAEEAHGQEGRQEDARQERRPRRPRPRADDRGRTAADLSARTTCGQSGQVP